MAQAETIPTTRRAFSKWLAVMAGAVAVPTAVTAAPTDEQPTADWDAFVPPLLKVLGELNRLDDEIKRREGFFEHWKRHHPWPVEPEYSSYRERVNDIKRLQAAQNAHAMRYQTALMQCGFGKLRPARNAAYDRGMDICKAIALTPVRNKADIRAKSNLAKYENESGPIHRVLIKELRNI